MLDAYRDLIDELLDTPTAIRDAVAESLSDSAALSIGTLVARIRDRDLQVLNRARMMMQRHDAYFDDLAPVSIDETELSLDQVLSDMEAARGDLVSLLINLSLKDWERTAILKSGGEITLSDMIEEHVEFDEITREQVRESLIHG